MCIRDSPQRVVRQGEIRGRQTYPPAEGLHHEKDGDDGSAHRDDEAGDRPVQRRVVPHTVEGQDDFFRGSSVGDAGAGQCRPIQQC